MITVQQAPQGRRTQASRTSSKMDMSLVEGVFNMMMAKHGDECTRLKGVVVRECGDRPSIQTNQGS